MRPWFDALLAGDEEYSVPALVWHSFLRLTTNRRIFPVPMPRREAFAFLDATCAQPHPRLTGPGPRHLSLLERLCVEAEAVGDLVPDAVLGAVALEHDCEVVTLDRDFACLPSVRHCRLPAA